MCINVIYLEFDGYTTTSLSGLRPEILCNGLLHITYTCSGLHGYGTHTYTNNLSCLTWKLYLDMEAVGLILFVMDL